MKLLRSIRDQIVNFDAHGRIRRSSIGPRPGREMIRMGLADPVDCGDEPWLELTEVGLIVLGLCLEIGALEEQAKRMRDGVFADMVGDRRRPTPPGAEPPALRIPDRGSCGNLNHDSFAVFLASLNAAGKNRWRDPGFTGAAPARAVQPRREGEGRAVR